MKTLKVLCLLPLICLFFSCAHKPTVYKEIDESIGTSYVDALRSMETGDARKVYDQNPILYSLDRGMLNHYAGHWAESSRELEEAERLIEEAFTKSLSLEIASYIVNDNTKEYSGEDYEDLYINVFNALNYYHRNDIEKAHVEIRRVNEKLVVLQDKYERATKKMTDSNPAVGGVDLGVEAVRFSNSALARYISLLFSRAEGNEDNVRIDMEELQRAYTLAPAVYGRLPSSLEEELSIPEEKARLNIIGFSGMSPVKEEMKLTVPAPVVGLVTIALPKLVERPSNITRVEVVVDSVERFNLELLEDMGKVAAATFNARYALTATKSIARAIVKAGATQVAGRVVEQRGGALLGAATRIAGTVVAAASEQADLRASRYFPGQAHVGGITLDPGTYSITVNFYGQGGALLASERRDNVQVEAGNLNLVQAVSLRPSSTQGSVGVFAQTSSSPSITGAPRVTETPRATETPGVVEAPEATEIPRVIEAPGISENQIFADYLVIVDGQPTGPYNNFGLRQLVNQGQLTKLSLVMKDGTTNWIVAGAVEELAPLFTAAISTSPSASPPSSSASQPSTSISATVPVQPPPQPAPTSRPAQVSDPDAWKKKWVYLGAALGGGSWSCYYVDNVNSPHNNSGGAFGFGMTVDLALLKYFSVGTNFGFLFTFEGSYPVLPIMAKVGDKFTQLELTVNAGYTLGASYSLGATFGFHVGPGILFAELFILPWVTSTNEWYNYKSTMTESIILVLLGYKAGIGKK